MNNSQFEPLSAGQIIDRTFRIYKSNFIRFITIVSIIYVPMTLLVLSLIFLFQNMAPTADKAEAVMVAGGITGFIMAIFFLLGYMLSQGALIRSVSEYYLGNDITVSEAYRQVLPKLLTLVGAGILIGLATMAGFVLLIVPGIIFMFWFSLATPAIIVENQGAVAGMKRSKKLVSGNVGKIFLVMFLAGIISAVISSIFSFSSGFLGGLLFSDNVTLVLFTNQLLETVGRIVVAPIGAIAGILLYYDLRIRKEGFDLEMLAGSLTAQ